MFPNRSRRDESGFVIVSFMDGLERGRSAGCRPMRGGNLND